ncbi:MAG: T9SS type A sorting domain-containing protein [Crocinitomicaceae bacterium]
MKKSKLILIGSIGIAVIAAVALVSPFAFNKKGGYTQNQLSFLQEQSADDAAAWIAARYFDASTGTRISDAKLKLIEKAVKDMPTPKSLPITWEEQGPDNIGGRTRAILIDKNNINHIYAGSVTGGLFFSPNKGSTWSKVEGYTGSKFISSIVQTADGTIYVATGMGFSADTWDGNGIFYTTDQGASWSTVPGTTTTQFSRIPEIVCAANSNKVWFATAAGLRTYTASDASMGTVTSPVSGSISAIQISKNGNVIVAAAGLNNKTIVSTDGGNTFTDKSGSTANVVPVGAARMEYAISPTLNANGNYNIYAVRTNSAGTLAGMNVSQDNGNTWAQFVGAAGITSNLNIYNGQGTYNTIVSVDPTDPERIFLGGLDIWKWKQTDNAPISGGFQKLSDWFVGATAPTYVHADNHEMKFDGNNRLYIGNDGGIGITNDFGATFYPSNRGYNVTQFYGVAFDRDGSVMGGAQDNGTLYNNHSLSTYKEFRQVGGGDGFQCEISFFNPKVMFSTVYTGAVSRSADGGSSFSSFVPDFPTSYTAANFPFYTTIGLAEYFDPNSKDSVTYAANKNYAAGATVRVPSASTGDSMNYVTPTAMYYDAFVENDPSLTQIRTSVKNAINGLTVLLGNYSYSYISGIAPPTIGDSLLVQLPGGPDTVVVASTSTYKWYFAKHPISNKVIELGKDSTAIGVSWDSARVADPFQSWFCMYVNKNNGEIWGTRDALRTSKASNNWVILAQNVGSTFEDIVEMEFSKDLNTCYISTGNKVTRLDGLGNLYTDLPSFPANLSIAPTDATQTTVYSGSVQGIALNPANAADLIVFQGLNPAKRSNNATSSSPTFTTLSPIAGANSPISYDGIIDRDDSDIIVVGTHLGVFVSSNGGSTWVNSSAGFEGTPVYEVRQSWKTYNEGNNRPGEIYIATFGRGIWSSSSLLNVTNNGTSEAEAFKTKLKTYPNPTSTTTTLSFNLEESGTVNVAVYSITGTKVKMIQKKNMDKGACLLDVEADDLPRGTYIIKLVSGSQSETTKFIKM